MRASAIRLELFYACAFSLCLVCLFREGLWGEVPAFRDTFHFYYPQLIWLDSCASAGEHFPLWNRSDGLGVSTLGQGTYGLLYPLRILFYLPGSVATRLAIFIMVHLLLAAAGVRLAASRLTDSAAIGWIAGASYALSGPVFFQHTNLVFLVGAAWLGIAAWGWLGLRGSPATLGQLGAPAIGLAVGMMILGGDPHSAVDTLVAIAALGLLEFVFRVRRSFAAAARWLGAVAALMTLATIIAGLVSMPQSIALYRAAKNSRLATADQTSAPGDEVRFARNYRIYDFSLPPWYAATLCLPTVFGDYSPSNSRWITIADAEGRLWTPSLYCGSLAAICLLLAVFRRGRSAVVLYGLAFCGFAFLASTGSYTITWLAAQAFKAIGFVELADALPDDPVFGVYWLISQLVPGYDGFRFPAKWTTFFALGASLVTASVIHEHRSNLQPLRSAILRYHRCMIPIGLFVLCAGVALVVGDSACWGWNLWLQEYLETEGRDAWLGFPDVASVGWTFCASSLTVAALCCFPALLARGYFRMLTLFVFAELNLVASCWTSFVATDTLETSDLPSGTDICLWADASEASIERDSSTNRFSAQQVAAYQAQFLLGKFALSRGVASLSNSQTLPPRPLNRMLGHFQHVDDLSVNQLRLENALRSAGVTHRLVRTRLADGQADFEWLEIPNPKPLCTAPRASSVRWQWPTNSELLLTVESELPTSVTIRQINDGGWHVACLGTQTDDYCPTIGTSRLGFLSIDVPAGQTQIRLTRKIAW